MNWVFSNIVPRRRDENGDALPRKLCSMRPLITADPQALLGFTKRLSESPENAVTAFPALRAAAAIAHEEKCDQLETELRAKQEGRQLEVGKRIDECKRNLKELDHRFEEQLPEAAAKASKVGIKLRCKEPRLDFADDEPLSDYSAAGLLGIPLPKPKSKLSNALAKLVAVFGGGTLFGVSLGLLVSGLTLSDLSLDYLQLILFAALGMAVIYLIGAALTPVAEYVGFRAELKAIGSLRVSNALLVAVCIVLIALAAAFLLIEAKVEQLGLLRTLTEENSLRSFSLSKTELSIVSFVLALPVVACYLSVGFFGGIESARQVAVLRAKTEQRQTFLLSEQFAEAAASHRQAYILHVRRTELAYRIAELEASLDDDLPLADKRRLEDCQSDAAAASFAAEDAITETLPDRNSSGRSHQRSRLAELWRAR